MGVISYEDLERLVHDGAIRTVVCAAPDLWGRLVGKRLTAQSFLRCASGQEGIHASTYLFCSDMEMEPRPGYSMTGWEKGFQDFIMVPDLGTIRIMGWMQQTAFVLCDAQDEHTGELLSMAPRTILKAQLARAAAMGLDFQCATELEFFTFRNTYDAAWEKRYRDLTPTSRYRADYHILQSSRDEDVIALIRDSMSAAGIEIENAKTEWGLGQQEIALRYAGALEMADRHVMYKTWIKELLSGLGLSATFMAKPFNDEVGSSCHIHISMWDRQSGQPVSSAGDAPGRMSEKFGSFIAGMIEGGADYTWMYAPSINSYKRFRKGSFAPVHFVLGQDNRTCGFRLVGHGKSFRVESRIPGADANPYLALAATIASGLDGVEAGLPAPSIYETNAYEDPHLPRVPCTMREAVNLFGRSARVGTALGEDVRHHLTTFAEDELEAFEQHTVTDWEMMRYFERV